jgi:hypothetical protein
MMYRAKCTCILSTIDNIYDLNKFYILRDSKDAYIEVPTEYEAECIERINKAEIEKRKATLDLIEAKANRH